MPSASPRLPRDQSHYQPWGEAARVDVEGAIRMQRQVEIRGPARMPVLERSALSQAMLRPVCIRYGGRDFIAAPEMAGIFLRHAQQLIDDGDAQLVPLLHRDGLELLLVADGIPLTVHEIPDR